jgi:hypothetical protein
MSLTKIAATAYLVTSDAEEQSRKKNVTKMVEKENFLFWE